MKVTIVLLPVPHLADAKMYCPLGPLYVAAGLERADIYALVADLRVVKEEDWLDHIEESDAYGISAMSMQYPDAIKLAHKLKARDGGRIVLGGVHATISEDLDPVFDSIVYGDGERAFPLLLGGKVICGESLDEYPYPARHLLPFRCMASKSLGDGEWATTITASRGCPYHCAFCASPRMYGGVRFRSPADIAAEIESLRLRRPPGYQIDRLTFLDDLLTVNLLWLRKFRDAIAPLRIQFKSNARVDTLDAQKIALLQEAGCIQLGLGVESVNQYTLDIIQKEQTVEQSRQAIALCKEAGLKTGLFLIIGLPGDFGDLSGRIIEFLKETQPDKVCVNSFIPFPGCSIYYSPRHYGLRFRDNYSLDNLKMRLGNTEDELDQDFTIEYAQMSNEDLKYHRRKVVEFVQQRGLA